jgi:two-component system, chemotaxis family, chemotaxis protein CheY
MSPRKRFRPLVLVADESKDARLMLRFYLSNEGYEVVEASGGQSAFECCAADSPDLVLIDLNMPGPSGVPAARRLRNIPQMEGVPVVAYAGPDSQAHRDAVRAAGADAYLTKPINPAVLLRLVNSLLRRRPAGAPVSADATQPAYMVV